MGLRTELISRTGPRERVYLPNPYSASVSIKHEAGDIADITQSTALTTPRSQGQGPARRHPRQDHLRPSLQRCPVLPPRHSCHPRRQTKDQRLARPEVSGGPGGEGTDQEGRVTQQVEHLQYVSPVEAERPWANGGTARAVAAAE